MNYRTVLITGGNSLLGRELALIFLENNWRVYATTKSIRRLTNRIINEHLTYIEMNLENSKSVHKAIQKLIRNESKIDVLVNNAGFVLAGAFESYTEKQIRREMDVNFFGSLFTIKELLPTMKKNNAGCIINISSLCGLVCFPLFSMYHASKWAIEGFSESLKYELTPFGIKVKLIEPGGIKDETYASKVEFGSLLVPEYEDYFNVVHKNTSWFPGFSTPKFVAKAVYHAATDNTNQLRYIIGYDSNLFLQERNSNMDDETYIIKMTERIFGKNDN